VARRGDRVDGILLLDKPGGLTSNFALQKARRLLNAAKAGHTGTLDPMATGLLPLTFGEAAKFSADLLDADKAYRATLTLGVTTSTGDAEGAVLERRSSDVSDEELEGALSQFRGDIEQVPPMHSALKRDGRPLYELARAGIEVERGPRRVTISKLTRFSRTRDEVVLEVECSKGTYVRVLAEDIGRKLNCGAHLSALRRLRVGSMMLDHSVTLEALEEMPPVVRREWLLPVDALLTSLPRIELDQGLAARFTQGQRLAIEAEPREARVRVYSAGSAGQAGLLGTAVVDEWGVLRPERLISNLVHVNTEKTRVQ
jgi:tRNA pseudouridine55 synthase